ncbi:MAG: alpha/beta hydrolase [Promethearchaeota archaeon]
MFEIEKLFVQNNDIKLEAEYFQSKSKKKPAVLLCHPHPQFGGNMWNNVVSGVFETLIQADISSMRFNFRATGHSTGTHGDGEEERSDVKACIDFLINKKKIEKILICGYSYGAAIGCSVINYSEKIIGYVAIAFPFDFMGTYFKEKAQTEKPKLFIQGTRDFIANYSSFKKHYEFFKEPKKFEILEGADHFFGGFEEKIGKIVLDFYKSLI